MGSTTIESYKSIRSMKQSGVENKVAEMLHEASRVEPVTATGWYLNDISLV